MAVYSLIISIVSYFSCLEFAIQDTNLHNIYIPIFQDGTIYEKGGGPKVEKTSGNRALDAAALKIIRKAAPFGNFPPNMRSKDKDDIWIVITRFKFTREQQLETEMRGGQQ